MSAITYKCPNCDGGLVFDPQSGAYVCEYCLSRFEEKDLTDQKTENNEETKETEDAKDIQEAVVYRCPSCGAEIVTDETTAATFCFYCHNPVVMEGKLQGEYLPDGIIPFKIAREEAISRFQEWIGKKKFIPRGFYSKRQIEKMSGVYFPYWIYDCQTKGAMSGTARDVRVWRVGDTEYTETKTYAIRREGELNFRHLPKTALQKAQNAMLKGIFPYEFGALEPFYMGYLSGFQAEKRDIEKNVLTETVHQEIQSYAKKRMRDTVSGHHGFSVEHQNYHISEEKFRYTLLPVWVLTYQERAGNVYYFAMNGQTGEIVGKLPVDVKKLLILGVTIFFAVLFLMLMGGLLV